MAASQRSAGGPAAVITLGKWQPGVAGELIGRRLNNEITNSVQKTFKT
jgi:hypothetical protein